MKKTLVTLLTVSILVNAVPAFAWNDSHCNTAIGETRAQKGKLLKHCIGKFSKIKYAYLYADYYAMNGGVDNHFGMPDRVKEVIKIADDAMNDHSIKWKKHSDQKHIDNAKLASAVIGTTVIALPTAVSTTLTLGKLGAELIGVQFIWPV